jgi:TonB family protein
MRFNGSELISDLSGEVFGLLLRTWIGAIPPSTGFKEELLGNQRNAQARDLLESLKPDKQRVALAASWILPAPVKPVAAKIAAPEVAAPKIAAPKIAASETKSIPAPELQPTQTAEIKEQPIKPAPSKGAQSADFEKPSASEDKDINKVAASDSSNAEQAGSETSDKVAEEAEEEIDFNLVEALAQRDYTPLVVQKIYQNISYPSRAVSKNQQGTVRVAIKIGRSGELQSALTTQKSRHSSLNKAALKAVEKAAPFPTLPEQITAESFELSIPITFRLQ